MDLSFANSALGVLYQNKENKRAAKRAMAFEDRMSSTAYQRAMKDMRAAGLNPILAGKVGGASTPRGQLPNIGNPVAAGYSAMQQATNAKIAQEQLKQAKMDTEYYKKTNMSPSQLKYTGLNAITSAAAEPIIQGGRAVGKQAMTYINPPASAKQQTENAKEVERQIAQVKRLLGRDWSRRFTKSEIARINAEKDYIKSRQLMLQILRSKVK